jgi:dihydroxyacetone kinase-like predicted kinase
MNPSTQDLLAAINRVEAEQVIVLPNNKNVVLAARQAARLTDKRVEVVPTRTVPQGIAALLALNYQLDPASNARAMERAMDTVRTGEITRAIRAAEIDGVRVEAGQIIGLLDGELNTAGMSVEAVADDLLRAMEAAGREIITLYYGQDVQAAAARALADRIREAYPGQDVEVVEGGQPHYLYIISVE